MAESLDCDEFEVETSTGGARSESIGEIDGDAEQPHVAFAAGVSAGGHGDLEHFAVRGRIGVGNDLDFHGAGDRIRCGDDRGTHAVLEVADDVEIRSGAVSGAPAFGEHFGAEGRVGGVEGLVDAAGRKGEQNG